MNILMLFIVTTRKIRQLNEVVNEVNNEIFIVLVLATSTYFFIIITYILRIL